MSQSVNLYINDVLLPKKSCIADEIRIIQNKVFAMVKIRNATHQKRLRFACKLLLEGLYQVFATNSERARLSLSFSQNRYKLGDSQKINRITFRCAMIVIDALNELGWIEINIGYTKQSGTNVLTTLRPQGGLLKVFENVGIIWQELMPSTKDEIIILKNYDPVTREKYIIPTPDTSKVRIMRRNLKKINNFIRGHSICLHRYNKSLFDLAQRMGLDTYQTAWSSGSPAKKPRTMNFCRTQLKRIFARSDMKKGGRFYGAWWQYIPSEERKYITIDGMGTIEIDYSEIHPRLLYLEQKLKPPTGDLYDLNIRVSNIPYDVTVEPYLTHRKVIKKYLNALINDETGNYKLSKADQVTIGMTDSQLRAKLLKRHPQIMNSLGVGKGLSYQYVDSQIAERVMLILMEKDIVCLPIHDSFICEIRYAKDLFEAMQQAYTEILNASPKIKKGIRYKSDFQIQFKPNGDVDKEATWKQHKDSIHNDFVASWRASRTPLSLTLRPQCPT